MTRHILISADPDVLERWTAAFPDALKLAEVDAEPIRSGPAAIVWLHVDAQRTPAREELLEAARSLASARIVALSSTPNDEEALAFLGAGISGYAHAYAAPPTLLQIATVVASGGLWVGPDLVKRLLTATRATVPPNPGRQDDRGLQSLSEREREVAIAIGRGLSNKEIARELAITERTVKAHLGSAFAKLGARDRLHLALKVRGSEKS